MSRLSSVFSDLRKQNQKGLIPYVVAGDPSPEGTVALLHSLVEAGADVLEVGVPFSDPMSEGPVIQQGHERALANGMSLQRVLEMVTAFRRDNDATPIVMMGYANPIERFGYDAFAKACAEAGVDGLITVDLPPKRSTPLMVRCSLLASIISFLSHRPLPRPGYRPLLSGPAASSTTSRLRVSLARGSWILMKWLAACP